MKTLKKLVSLMLVLCTLLCVFSFPVTASAKSATKTVSKVALNSKKETIYVGNTFQIVPTAKTSSGKKVSSAKFTYKSSKTSVATVNKTGLVTAKKEGSAKITVTEKTSKKTATLKVTVTYCPIQVTDVMKRENENHLTTDVRIIFDWSGAAVKQLNYFISVYDAFNNCLWYDTVNTDVNPGKDQILTIKNKSFVDCSQIARIEITPYKVAYTNGKTWIIPENELQTSKWYW